MSVQNTKRDMTPVGALANIIIKYIEHKNALGYQYTIEKGTLYRFSVFTLDYEIKGKVIPQKLINGWLQKRPFEKNNTYKSRTYIVVNMLKFSKNYGYIIPEIDVIKVKTEKYHPYIFTQDEIRRIFYAADHIEPYTGSWRHIISPVLFRLIYSCGLRSTEAASLKCCDVDFEHNTIILHEAKFKKERIVPFSASMSSILQTYYYSYRNYRNPNEYLFPAKYNEHLKRAMVYKWFRRILDIAKIHHLGKGFGPREHDLRHSFCVHSLKKMQDKGIDLYVGLPLLSTYLGHVSIKETQHYLRLTPEFYPDLEQLIEKYTSSIIPTRGEYDETY